ncbi:MAG: hypothetical protein ABSB87_06755 [Terriglobales bacterium]
MEKSSTELDGKVDPVIIDVRLAVAEGPAKRERTFDRSRYSCLLTST